MQEGEPRSSARQSELAWQKQPSGPAVLEILIHAQSWLLSLPCLLSPNSPTPGLCSDQSAPLPCPSTAATGKPPIPFLCSSCSSGRKCLLPLLISILYNLSPQRSSCIHCTMFSECPLSAGPVLTGIVHSTSSVRWACARCFIHFDEPHRNLARWVILFPFYR